MNLSFREKYSYGIGALGKDAVYALVATYLMMFFTDVVGISSVFVGGLFFVARFWDAINDPMMGMIVDNTHTKWGKFRPWILIGTIINAIVIVFLFVNPTNFLDGKMVYVYCAVAYLLWGMTYTIMDIPYWSMIPALSNDPADRDKITVIPKIFATLGGSFINSFGILIVAKLAIGAGQSRGYFILGLGVATVFVVCSLITVLNVKEVNVVPNKEKINLKQVFEILGKNDQLIVIIATVVVYYIGLFLTGGFALYYFKYVIRNEALYTIFTTITAVAQLVSLMFFPKIVAKLSRRVVFILSCILPVVGFMAMFFVGRMETINVVLLCMAGIIYNIGFAFEGALGTVMLADAVDYGEFKLGKRNESVVFSMQPFIVKFSTALSGLIVGIGLQLIKYVPNVEQTVSTINGMQVMMFLIPSLLMLGSLFIYVKFYKLNGDFYKNMLWELSVKRNNSEEKNSVEEIA